MRGPLPGGGGESRLEKLKTFDFDHTSMTMSVVVPPSDSRTRKPPAPARAAQEVETAPLSPQVRTPEGKVFAFCKGAPEKVLVKCTEASKPADTAHVAAQHAFEGCYVLGLACKELDPETGAALERSQVEVDLTFAGLLLFRNGTGPPRANPRPCSLSLSLLPAPWLAPLARHPPRVLLTRRDEGRLGGCARAAQGGRRPLRDGHRRQRAVRTAPRRAHLLRSASVLLHLTTLGPRCADYIARKSGMIAPDARVQPARFELATS